MSDSSTFSPNYPKQFIGKDFGSQPQNRINRPKGIIDRRTFFKRYRKDALARGEEDPILRVMEAMQKEAEKGNVAAANLMLDSTFGKILDRQKVDHNGNVSLLDLVVGSMKDVTPQVVDEKDVEKLPKT